MSNKAVLTPTTSSAYRFNNKCNPKILFLQHHGLISWPFRGTYKGKNLPSIRLVRRLFHLLPSGLY